ncbi:uncharacterized protein EAF02_006412 [Botrytis sinoallii]|uniref:uncharacterized protein n=1 Tax=Botrytis sinoallii TaxID=1463999 RepID=UPI001901EFD3|nr:uncharacterized protein EAF02_006412 [Botrytis sinoallii]KAF7881724.1 hypothetical protein EAF02_006412 [Botrytis sinoallii]
MFCLQQMACQTFPFFPTISHSSFPSQNAKRAEEAPASVPSNFELPHLFSKKHDISKITFASRLVGNIMCKSTIVAFLPRCDGPVCPEERDSSFSCVAPETSLVTFRSPHSQSLYRIKKRWQLADKAFHDRVGTGMPRSSHCLSRGSARTDLVRESGVRKVLVNWPAYRLENGGWSS